MAGENKMSGVGDSYPGTIALAFPAAQIILSGLLAYFVIRKTMSRVDKFLVVWLIYNATTHLVLEGYFVYVSFRETVGKAAVNPLSFIWKEYARADKRWAGFDGTIVSIELITATLATLLALVLVQAIINGKWYRHFVQIILCTMELYGGYMTFAPEYLSGNKNLVTSNPLYLWVYLVFFNGLWVVIPLYMLWNSWSSMEPAVRRQRSSESPKKATPATPGRYNLRSRKDN